MRIWFVCVLGWLLLVASVFSGCTALENPAAPTVDWHTLAPRHGPGAPTFPPVEDGPTIDRRNPAPGHRGTDASFVRPCGGRTC